MQGIKLNCIQLSLNRILDDFFDFSFFDQEINIVKYDLNFAKNSSQNQFDYELYNKSVEM